jgi:hypothetical protein
LLTLALRGHDVAVDFDGYLPPVEAEPVEQVGDGQALREELRFAIDG